MKKTPLEEIKSFGGYVSYDQFDKIMENHYMPIKTYDGWGCPFTFKQNQIVLYAQDLVDNGKIINTGNGYRVK